MIKPLSDRVLAEKELAATTTASGILLGDAKEEPNLAKIKAVGPEVKDVKVDDKIIFKAYAATEVKIDHKDYLIIKEEDILAKF